MDWFAFQTGATAFIIAFAAASAFFVAFKFIYQLITPYHESSLIREGNAAAAVSLGGALIGFVLPLASALSQTVSLIEFAAWATLAGVIQIVAFIVVSRLVYKGLAGRIEAGEMAAALYMASISIGVGLLNAACMTT
jgi:putative membrane protein